MQIAICCLSNASAKTERENNRPRHREPLEGSRDQVLIASRTNDITKFNPQCDSDKQTMPFESDVWNNGARELMHGN